MPAPKPARRKKPHIQQKTLKRKRETEDLDLLSRKVTELDTAESYKNFADLPLSQPTRSGLESSHFTILTDIQRKGIPFALKGNDILGAAKTGSGKTLAFLVPMLECLYREKWTEYDGLGALILSPTRELAIQIFEVLRKIGRYHTFSAGLVIGGKSVQEESARLGRMNILVCTPGRILQHMDQTAALEVHNLKMLVLDEADRILDMGFQNTVDAIVEHLPKERQTLLFSATQTKKVSDLARLSLREPEYVAVHETATPSTLQQHYVITPLPEKLDTLYGFIRANLKNKILVFLSSGKQVRFVYESFRQLQPGIPLLHLHGRQKQTARLDITTKFSQTQTSCLFATDVVARGLDFPAVDWVIQLDCPEDADTYIHRVGRTARYERDGRAVLFLDPGEEEGMLKRLEQKKVVVEEIKVRQKKQQSIKSQLQNMCFKDAELKYLGQKAFISYVKSVHTQRDKEIFKVENLQLKEFAASLGLPGEPQIKLRKGADVKKLKNTPRQQVSSDDDSEPGGDSSKAQEKQTRTKYDRMFERRNQDVLSKHYANVVDQREPNSELPNEDSDEEDGFMSVKRRLDDADIPDEKENVPSTMKSIATANGDRLLIDSKRREKMLKSKKALLKTKGAGTKLVFNDEGKAHELYELETEEDFRRAGPAAAQRANFIEAEADRVKAADIADKQAHKDKKREKRLQRKARERDLDVSDGYEDELQLVPFEGVDDGVESPGESPAPKRSKKWFEDDSESEETRQSARKWVGAVEDADTLEDLERLAASYL